MGEYHLEDDGPAAPPTWRGRVVELLAEAAVLLACVVGLCDVLWLGHRLLSWSSWIVVALAVLLLLVRKRRSLAAACMLGLLAVGWPWLRVAFDPHASELPESAAVEQRVVAIDLRGFAGDAQAAVAALIATDASLIAAICDPAAAVGDELEAAEGYRWDRDVLLRRMQGDVRTPVARLIVISRRAPHAAELHVDGGSDGLILDLHWDDDDDGTEQRVLVPAFGDGGHPRRFVRQVPIIDRLGELAADPGAGALVVVAPVAWDRAAPRWRAVAAATGTAVPERGLPATGPRWLPRPFAAAETAIAVRGLGMRASGLTVPGAPRRAVVVDLGAAAGHSR